MGSSTAAAPVAAKHATRIALRPRAPLPAAQEEQAMKRFHVHLGVPDLSASIRFYSDLFGMAPTVEKPDYAKWMLDDPRVNFAISQRGARTGLNHLGLQVDSAEELAGIRTQFAAADEGSVTDGKDVSCCYARSDKHWVRDPQGIPWEAYHSLGKVEYFDGATQDTADAGGTAAACCAPAEATSAQPAVKRAACCG
jgi:catechol 2,3-dioxygenase-like lactoylglutathione lyase family enzyme